MPRLTSDLLQDSEVANLRNQLNQYSDYDEIKRELDIMKVLLSSFVFFPQGF